MVKKAYSPEQIIGKLREAEILLSQGATIAETSNKIGVTEQTYYRWRKEYGGLQSFKTEADDTDLGQILRAEAIARGG